MTNLTKFGFQNIDGKWIAECWDPDTKKGKPDYYIIATLNDGLTLKFKNGKYSYDPEEKEERLRDMKKKIGDTTIDISFTKQRDEPIKNSKAGFIEVMLGKRFDDAEDIVEELKSHSIRRIIIDYKLDGIRAQVHKNGSNVVIYSRNEKTYNHQFPELVEATQNLPINNVIFEGEIVAISNKGRIASFQHLSQRTRRLEDVSTYIERVPIRLFVFDVLEYNDKNIENKPLEERVVYINDITESSHLFKKVPSITVNVSNNTVEKIDDFTDKSLEDGNEGVMVKNADSPYQEGKRSSNWMKLKRQFRGGLNDTIDCIIIGADYGLGKRSGGYGSFLLGVKYKNEYTPIGRVGSGFTDEDLKVLTNKLGTGKQNGDYSDVEFTHPKIILEVYAEEITKSPTYPLGLGLRFPKVKTIRNDKDVKDVSTFKDVEELYNSQPSVKQKDMTHKDENRKVWF